MGFVKTQSVEKVEVVSADGHRQLEEDLKKTGKTSARELTETERSQVLDKR